MSTEQKLAGKTALITGASKGLGKAMALAFADAGARLALVSRDAKLLAEVQAACRARGAEAEVYQVDVTSEAQVEQLKQAVLARFGKLTILVNNAGINIRKPVTDFTLAEWHQVMDTNLTSVFLLCRAFVPHLETGCGRIINLASMMAHISIAHRVPYSASKAGILGLTKSLALELAGQGITANAISELFGCRRSTRICSAAEFAAAGCFGEASHAHQPYSCSTAKITCRPVSA